MVLICIQYFVENVIPQLEKIEKTFMGNPLSLGECIMNIQGILRELGCQMVAEMLEECNTLLEESGKHRMNWQIKDHKKKSLRTVLGLVVYTHTRFQHKTTKKTVYLLDRILGIAPHIRLSEEVCEQIILEAAQSSYQKAGESLEGEDVISRERVIRHVDQLSFPRENAQKPKEKRQVKYLYVEADEDHISL